MDVREIVEKHNLKVRQSNMELLRIAAMVLVLVVHVNGALFHAEGSIIDPDSWQCLVWSFVESVSICCVNIFVMISGWFGIHPTVKGLLSFLFQIAFFLVFCFAVACLFGITNLHEGGLLSYFLCAPGDWFTKSYLLLYLLSPVLNSFITTANEKTVRHVLIGFFIFQTFWGWYWGVCDFFKDGYSTISFIGLYLLAAYSRRYLSSISTLAVTLCLSGCILFNAIVSYTFDPLGSSWTFLLMNYINPLVVIQSLAIVLLFSRLKFQSPQVNWIAVSCYSVYLTHKNHFFFDRFGDYSRQLFLEHSQVIFGGAIFLYISIVFFASILVDKIRISVWTYLINTYNKCRL